MDYENPWTFDDVPFTDTDILKYYGFVYQITNKITGKKYIGRKYFTGKRKGKRVPSDWKKYYGSSKDLQADVLEHGKQNFSRAILSLHESRGDTNFYEVKTQIERNVLEAKNASGEYEYFNTNIALRYFRLKKIPNRKFAKA